jgi:hypothetical protein
MLCNWLGRLSSVSKWTKINKLELLEGPGPGELFFILKVSNYGEMTQVSMQAQDIQ